MDIRFISSLTPEDEASFAPALLRAACAVLDQLPIAYTIRIQTTASHVYQRTHAAPSAPAPAHSPNHRSASSSAG